MSRGRRIKPSTVEGRRRQAELGQIISSPRTSKSEREAALEELNTLAPIAGSGSLLADEDSKPSKRDLDALVERAEARRAGEESILLPSPPALLSAADIRAVSGMDLRSATAEWYRLVQSQWPEVASSERCSARHFCVGASTR